MSSLAVILLMILSSIIGAFGAIYLKKGSPGFELKGRKILASILNKQVILGILLYAVAAVVVIILLKTNDLSFIYPLTSLQYIFVVLLSYILLREKITRFKWLAVCLIVIGNVFIAL
jgi:drug/metabolite transporter (DMT)-like permease